MVSDPRRWLIAVFESEPKARDVARLTMQFGTAPEAIRVGDPLDALTSIRGEMREGANDVVMTSTPKAAPVIALPLAASTGTTLAVPDSQYARHVLLHAGSVRVDVVGPDGRPIDTLRARRRRLATRHDARHPRRVRRFC